jgi:hypothetical protein
MRVFLTKLPTQLIAVFVSLCAASAGGQVQVQSHPGIDVPKGLVNHLFNMTCRVVAEEFRLGDASEVQVPVTLIVGESRDGLVGDETNQIFTIYMSRWDETMFPTAVSRIALQHLLSRDRKARIARESLRRAHLVAPISVDALAALEHRPPPSPSAPAATALPRALLNRALPCPSSSASPFPAESEDHVLARPDSFCNRQIS